MPKDKMNPARPTPTRWLASAILSLTLTACGDSIAELSYEVRRTLPHDAAAYTQGLLLHDGSFYESTGQYGESDLREVDVTTGEVLRIHKLADDHFGEGLALVEDKLIQLTWKAGLAFIYDLETFQVTDTLTYDGEGWGLCYDGTSIYMSNGSGTLARRDPVTFAILDEIRVTRDGFSVRNLNELECVNESIYANLYESDEIVRIDKASGEITGKLDAYSLSVGSGRPLDPGAVLNGIAYDEAIGAFYLTGKMWPALYEVAISGG